MLLTSDAAFGFGQGVIGGAGFNTEEIITDKVRLKNALRNLSVSTNRAIVLTLNEADYDFTEDDEREFTLGARNLTIRGAAGKSIQLKNLGLIFDLRTVDNLLIRNLEFQSDGRTGSNDGLVFSAEEETEADSSFENRVRITRCTFNGYKDQAIEIRTRFSRLLATIDHCYFFDNNPGRGEFKDRGAINMAGVILGNGKRTTANSFVTIAFNYFENVWRRSPRVAADGTHAHVFNNLLYRWGYQQDGVTDKPSWNGMETELQLHKRDQPQNAAMAVIQANRYIPWSAKQSKAIDIDAGTLVDIGGATSLANRFDNPDGTSGNTALAPRDGAQTIDVNAWYNSLRLAPSSLRLAAPTVMTTGEINWVTLASNAGHVARAAGSIPTEISR